jgi:hypothetical protein
MAACAEHDEDPGGAEDLGQTHGQAREAAQLRLLALQASLLICLNITKGLWRACNLTAFIFSLTCPVGQPYTSCHEGPKFNPQGRTYLKPVFSC